jgi:hypothetical protein
MNASVTRPRATIKMLDGKKLRGRSAGGSGRRRDGREEDKRILQSAHINCRFT